jgi:pimeloyl-ACP methyl ester carboxylesterase
MVNGFPVIYEKLGRSQVPVLLLWGDKDRTLPLKQSESILKLLPKTEFHVIENCGHIPHFEVPELVNRILVEFLASK